MSDITPLLITVNHEHHPVEPQDKTITLHVQILIPDPNHPLQRTSISKFRGSFRPDESVNKFISRVSHYFPAMGNRKFYLKFKQQLYEGDELKISDIGIENGNTVELLSLESEKQATENEGFIFCFWSIVPIIVSISFIVSALVGTFDMVYRGLFVLIGTIIGVPASILFIIGFSERLSEKIRISFVNYTWFGPCCSCCRLCRVQDEGSVDLSDEV